MMMRAAFAALLCGAAAQEVSLGGTALSKIPANTALGAGYSDDGTIIMMPSWLDQAFADYFQTPSFTSSSLTLTAENGGLAPGRTASALGNPNGNADNENACGMGWAKSESGPNTCFSDIAGLRANNWGWSNRISPGDDFNPVPVYIGASGCANGIHRFDIAVKYEGTTITVDLTPVDGWSLRAAHVYVGRDLLPTDRRGAYSDAPGGFPVFVNVGDSDVVTFTDDIDGTSDYYFAVHVNVCPDKEQPPTPELCPSTFYIAQYFCGFGPCTAGVTGNLPALLAADGWEHVGHGPCFSLPATADFPHETKTYRKEVADVYTTPQSDGWTSYVGVFATGCGESLTPPPPPSATGPTRRICAENCPPGSDGFGAVPN